MGLIITNKKELAARDDVHQGSLAAGIKVRHRPCGCRGHQSPAHERPEDIDMGRLPHGIINKAKRPGR
jgi:hypothetical protein